MCNFARNLKTLRKNMGATQDTLAEKLNVTRQTISSWETGRSEPDLQMLDTLAQVLGVDVSMLIAGGAVPDIPGRGKNRITSLVCFLTVLVVMVLQLTLCPYLRKLAYNHYITYLFDYERIVPPIGFFAAGMFIPSLLSLRFPVSFEKKTARWIFIAGVALAFPAFLSMIETLIHMVVSSYPEPFFQYVLIPLFIHYSAQPLIVSILPFISGILVFFGVKH